MARSMNQRMELAANAGHLAAARVDTCFDFTRLKCAPIPNSSARFVCLGGTLAGIARGRSEKRSKNYQQDFCAHIRLHKKMGRSAR
jgi:hypothetical protein